jgi:myo-inositol-1(or 4)-monophosphatase
MDYDIKQLQRIIVSAGKEELLPRFTRVGRTYKADGSVLTEADLAVQERVAAQLQERWPGTVFLGEEMSAGEQQALLASDKPAWCLDPLDGTRNFSSGIPYFCISLALLQGGSVSIGLVYDPVRDECFAAGRGQGAFLNNDVLAVMPAGLGLKQTTAIIDFKRLDAALATRLATEIPYASQRSFGSVALDWCWLAAGRCHLYLHGRSNIWDYAAGELILREAGGYACTLDGEPVFSRALVPRSSVGAVDEPLFRAWTDWLGIRLETDHVYGV